MREELIKKSTTQYFRIMQIIHSNEIDFHGIRYCPMTQMEIGEEAGISPMTTNSLFKQLKQDGMVHLCKGKKGRYYLSEEASKFVEAVMGVI